MITFRLKRLAHAYHWIYFDRHLIKSMNTLMLVWILNNINFIIFVLVNFCKNGHHFSSRLFWLANANIQKHEMKQGYNLIISFEKLSTFFTQGLYMDIKDPIKPATDGKHIFYVIADLFSNYIIFLPTPKQPHCAVNALIHYCISKTGPPRYLIADRRTEYLNFEMASDRTVFNFRNSPRTSNSHWTNGFVEVQIKILEPIWECFYMTPMKTGLFKSIFCPYSQNSTIIKSANFVKGNKFSHTTA